MSLAILGYAMVIAFMVLIITGRMTALIALILVPIVFAVIGGFGAEIGPMVTNGIRAIAPTGILLLFAILYFGLMIDVGLFDPLVRLIVRLAKGDPVRLIVGSAALALVISLDGDGSTTYLLCITAMLPLHRRLGVNPLILPCVTMLANSIMNIAPWGGPTARVMTALKLDASQVFLPLIPGMAMASLATLAIAWYLGTNERKRIGGKITSNPEAGSYAVRDEADLVKPGAHKSEMSSALKFFNVVLTLTLMVLLVSGLVPLALLFMVAYGIAVTANFPKLGDQKECMSRHAASAVAVVSVIFAAGVFTGILSGTKMTDAIAHSITQMIPPSAGVHLPLITAMLSAPFTFFISNDAFYFGVVPVLAETAKGYGVAPEVIARASLIGQPVHQLSPLVAANYVLIGLAGVEFGAHQRFTLKWTFLLMFILLIVAGGLGVIPLLHPSG